MPLETLMAESDGVPLRVHRAASAWAQAQAAERLEASAGRAAGERGELRAAQAELAGSVADLQVARERTRLYAVDEPPDPSAPEVCPFRGLAPFDAAHAEYFFGRERLVADLVARLVGSTLLAVFGPSGSGKSSVIRAGLLPALADGVLPGSERWRQALMRPGEHPLAELAPRPRPRGPEAGQRDGDDPSPRRSTRSRPTSAWSSPSISSRRSSPPVATRASAPPFSRRSSRSPPTPTSALVVVLAIRADFYGRCAEYTGALDRRSAPTRCWSGRCAARSCAGRSSFPPAGRACGSSRGLVSALVGDVADEPGGLPLLSTALLELWQERSGRTLRQASYERERRRRAAPSRASPSAPTSASASPSASGRGRSCCGSPDAEEAALVRRRVPLARARGSSATRTPPRPSPCSPRAGS